MSTDWVFSQKAKEVLVTGVTLWSKQNPAQYLPDAEKSKEQFSHHFLIRQWVN